MGIIFAIGAIIFASIIGVAAVTPSSTPLPTPVVFEPLPLNSPSSNPSSTSNPNYQYFKVTSVTDGDTFKIETGESVRMIGIDTPETVHPSQPVGCFGKEASDKAKSLLSGKIVGLEKDITNKDKYDRLLRYVYLDGVFINDLLVREGFAQSYSYPPDIKFQNQFLESQKKAREENKGLWSSACASPTPTAKPVTISTPKPTTSTYMPPTTGSWTCNCAKTCAAISSCAEAQYQLNTCGCSQRDADDDGIACDADCQ